MDEKLLSVAYVDFEPPICF